MTYIDPDNLVVPNLPKVFENSPYPVDEAVVTRCMDPAQKLDWNADGMDASVVALCRTSILHVVDADESSEVVRSMMDGESSYPKEVSLPRLPYSRVAIETVDKQGWKIAMTDGSEWTIYALFISERVPGKVWDCCWFWARDPDMQAGDPPFMPYSMTWNPDTGFRVFAPDGKEDDAATGFAAFAVELAHVIGADKIPREPVTFVSRQQRKHWKSQFNVETVDRKPRIYFLDLKQAGDTQEQIGSGRIYTVRWIVRGHWRHFAGGTKTWIKPYVKGPIGAPWKGRPIYT